MRDRGHVYMSRLVWFGLSGMRELLFHPELWAHWPACPRYSLCYLAAHAVLNYRPRDMQSVHVYSVLTPCCISGCARDRDNSDRSWCQSAARTTADVLSSYRFTYSYLGARRGYVKQSP